MTLRNWILAVVASVVLFPASAKACTPAVFDFYFEAETTALRPYDEDHQRRLEWLSQLARGSEPAEIRIAGFAGWNVSEEAWRTLAQARADTIRDELVRRGVSSDRIHVTYLARGGPPYREPETVLSNRVEARFYRIESGSLVDGCNRRTSVAPHD